MQDQKLIFIVDIIAGKTLIFILLWPIEKVVKLFLIWKCYHYISAAKVL